MGVETGAVLRVDITEAMLLAATLDAVFAATDDAALVITTAGAAELAALVEDSSGDVELATGAGI